MTLGRIQYLIAHIAFYLFNAALVSAVYASSNLPAAFGTIVPLFIGVLLISFSPILWLMMVYARETDIISVDPSLLRRGETIPGTKRWRIYAMTAGMIIYGLALLVRGAAPYSTTAGALMLLSLIISVVAIPANLSCIFARGQQYCISRVK